MSHVPKTGVLHVIRDNKITKLENGAFLVECAYWHIDIWILMILTWRIETWLKTEMDKHPLRGLKELSKATEAQTIA